MNRSEKLERALRLCMERMCKCCLAEAQHKSTKLKAVCENGCETLRIAKEALEEPPRNCDVGTADEQMKRQHDTACNTTVACPDSDWSCRKCFAEWGQMPYREGGTI